MPTRRIAGAVKADPGCDDYYNKLLLDDRLGRVGVEFLVERDDAAEGRLWICAVGALVGFEQRITERDTTRIGVFHDNARGAFVELLDTFQCRIGVGDVVVTELFSLQLSRGRYAGFL